MRAFSLKAIRRRPKMAYHALLTWLIHKLTRSDMVHVAIGDSQIVLDPSLEGVLFHESTLFCMQYPWLGWCVVVPTDKPVDLARFEGIGPLHPLPSFLRWITLGLWPARDCVGITIEALRRAGVKVPNRIVTPGELWDFFRFRDFEFIEMET